MERDRREVRIRKIFRQAGGMLRTGEALRAGVHPRDLYALRDAGALELVSRGVYRLAELPPLAEPDLFAVAARVPKAVIALVSALHFHGLTTEIPHEVSVALPKGTARPRLAWPPLRVVWLSGAMFSSGIETHQLPLRRRSTGTPPHGRSLLEAADRYSEPPRASCRAERRARILRRRCE